MKIKKKLVKSNINEIILKGSVDNFERVYVYSKNRRINIILSATLMPDRNHILLKYERCY